MRPARIIAAVVLTAAAAVAGASIALSTAHPSAAARAAVAAPSTVAGTSAPASSTVTSSAGGATTAARPTPAPPPRLSDPALAARHLFDAWQAHDRQRALQAASPSAVRALLAISPTPRPRFTGCRYRSFGYDCHYWHPDAGGVSAIDMRVEGGASAGYRVVAISAPLRFANPQAAADHLVAAWLADDRAEARKAASAAAVDTMFLLRDRRHPPSFIGCTYRSPGFDCAYTTGSAVGDTLVMRVTGGASAGWVVEAVDVPAGGTR